MSNTSDLVEEHTEEVKFEKEELEKENQDEQLKEPCEIEKGEEGENEKQEKEKIKVTKKKRCQRKKEIFQTGYEDKTDYENGIGIFLSEEEEEEEEEKNEESEEDEEWAVRQEKLESREDDSDNSSGVSVLSAITFEWENETYEFDELCLAENTETLYKRYYSEPELVDEIGVVRYLHACNFLHVTPMFSLLRLFETDEIDLSFRNVDSKSLRAMCYSLETNIFVERLILRFNKLRPEDCFYLGRMLRYNEKISHLDLTGCKINPQGAQILIEYLFKNASVSYLNLSKCNLQDEGMILLSQLIMHNNSIQNLDLSYNKLGDGAAESLGLALKVNKSITNLNLQYNNLFDAQALKGFFRSLMLNPSITHLNLSWNGMSGREICSYIGNYLKKSSSLIYLDISDNRFEGSAIGEIRKGLVRSKGLITLKIGNNPLSPEDLESLLIASKNCSTLQVLDFENLWVKKSFMKALKRIQQEKEIKINVEGVLGNYEIRGPDYPKVILQRAQFEAMKPKNAKKRKDFGHFIWSLGDEPMSEKEFMSRAKKFKAKINKELYPELIKEFLISKAKLIDVAAMRKKYLSIFSDSEPLPSQKEKNQKKKGSKQKEGKKDLDESGAAEGEEHAVDIYPETEMSEEEEKEEGAFIGDTEYEEETEEYPENFEVSFEGENEGDATVKE